MENSGRIVKIIDEITINRYVDIIDYTTGEIYEIKPYNGVVDGARQVSDYLDRILNNIQVGEFFGEQNWRLGDSWPIPAIVCSWPLGGAITVLLNQPGLIYYKVTRSDSDAYDNAYNWNMLKLPEFNVGYVTQEEMVFMLLASLPGIIALVKKFDYVNYCFAF